MTEIPTAFSKSTPLAVFLSSVCPGLPFLDDNTHFRLVDSLSPSKLRLIENFNWPLTGLNGPTTVQAHLDPTYLNVSRPPFQDDVHKNIESTTYVPLPLHYTSLFAKLVSDGTDHKQDGAKHIGANVNPLLHDPFRLVHLNPGCLSSVITLDRLSGPHEHKPDFRNPFNKMTSSLNKLLRMGGSESSQNTWWQSILSETDTEAHFSHSKNIKLSGHEPLVISSILDFDKKSYLAHVSALRVTKLLISVNVNVLNVFALSDEQGYACTSTIQSSGQIYPQQTSAVPTSAHSSSGSSSLVQSISTPYTKVIERPILRIQLSAHIIVTSIGTISSDLLVVLGMSNGNIFMLNLKDLTYRHFDDFGNALQPTILSSANAVTSLCAVSHPTHGLLLVAGYATGEVTIIDPTEPPKSLDGHYVKTVRGSDRFVTYFKTFDLSGWSEKLTDDDTSAAYLVGHFKISHKPITSIASTIPNQGLVNNSHKPMILAFASEDGLIRFVDLIATFGKNYGTPGNSYSMPIVTDIVSNYFQDGVRDIDFSPDNKFFVSCGKGDLVEIFKMSYYNVNALLHKDSANLAHQGGRSRSGTIASSNSSNFQLLASFLAHGSTSTSFDLPRAATPENYFAPTIKDIAIVSRLKGHSNIVLKVSFVDDTQLFSPRNGSVSGTYNLITSGNDGKVNFWEFNNKSLPRLKKSHFTTNAKRPSLLAESSLTPQLQSLSSRGKSISGATKMHKASRSFNFSDDSPFQASFSKLGINNLLAPHSQTAAPRENTEEQLQIVFSLYRSLYEMRLKKHYAKQKKDLRTKYPCVIHGVVNDKDLPSMHVPIMTMELSGLVRNGQISGYHCDSHNFLVFGKSGDIFRYKISS